MGGGAAGRVYCGLRMAGGVWACFFFFPSVVDDGSREVYSGQEASSQIMGIALHGSYGCGSCFGVVSGAMVGEVGVGLWCFGVGHFNVIF